MINNNSEILFLYDAQMCNPNGDMDNENKPRMDYDTFINLVSDVRLKRYIRDYFEDIKGEEIFISNKAKDAKERNSQIKAIKKGHIDLIDVRLFGRYHRSKTGAGKIIHGTWGILRCYNAGTSTHKNGNPGFHRVIDLDFSDPIADRNEDFSSDSISLFNL